MCCARISRVKYLRISGYVKKKKNGKKGTKEEKRNAKRRKSCKGSSGKCLAEEWLCERVLLSTADTACPPCKIKRVHGALCHDQNSQAVHDIFYSHFASVPNWPASTVYIAFNIGPRGDIKTR